jgi:hypothetical protein
MAKKMTQGVDPMKVDTNLVSQDTGPQQPPALSSGTVDGVTPRGAPQLPPSRRKASRSQPTFPASKACRPTSASDY